jgi:hypothetical protein
LYGGAGELGRERRELDLPTLHHFLGLSLFPDSRRLATPYRTTRPVMEGRT